MSMIWLYVMRRFQPAVLCGFVVQAAVRIGVVLNLERRSDEIEIIIVIVLYISLIDFY
jgi:hypothetical protein